MTKTKKLPRGCVRAAHYLTHPDHGSQWNAVIPCLTKKEARAWIRLANRVADSYPRSNKVLTKHDYYCLRYLGIPTP